MKKIHSTYRFEWRGKYRTSILTSAIAFFIFVRDPLIGLRPVYKRKCMLLLPSPQTVFFSDGFRSSYLFRIFSFLISEIEPTTKLLERYELDVAYARDGKKCEVEPENRCDGNWNRPAVTQYTATGVRVCIIDSGCDRRIPIAAAKITFTTFVEAPADQDPKGHGTSVALVVSGWQRSGQICNGLATRAELMIAKVRGLSMEDDEVRLETVEIALNWALEQGAHVVVAALGNPRMIEESLTGFASGVSRLLAAFPQAMMVCSTGERRTSLVPTGVKEPAAATGTVAVAGWDACERKHPPGGAESDSYATIHFSGPSHGLDVLLCSNRDEPDSECRLTLEKFGNSSAACAYVAGVVALYCEKHANAADKRATIVHEMAKDAWRDPDSWCVGRGGFGIPKPPI